MGIWQASIIYNITDKGCWECTSYSPCTNGYCMKTINKKKVYIHRLMYSIHKLNGQEIPKGIAIRHTCDNPICINPEHLLEGTHLDNLRDMKERNRQAKGTKIKQSVLTELQVLDIISNKELTQKELALMYNTTSSNISRIKTGDTWNWLTHIRKEELL